MTTDPERLLDSHADDLGARLLSAALDEPAPAGLLERTLASVAVTGPGTPGPTGPSGPSGGEAPVAGKSALGAAKALAAGGGIGGAIVAGAMAGVVTAAAWFALSAPVSQSPTLPSIASAPPSAVVITAPAPSLSAEALQHDAGPHDVDPPPAAAGEREGRGTGGASARVLRTPETLPSEPRTRPTPNATPVPSSGRNLARETALLDEVRRAILETDGARALDGLNRYSQEFPNGQLAYEAAGLRAQAVEASRIRPRSSASSDTGTNP